jgi:hypothetical protein
MRRRRLAMALALGLASLALGAPVASATYHLMNVREVYPGSATSPAAEYVELQMWAAGQNFVAGEEKNLHIYGPTGVETAKAKFPSDVKGGADQSTLVLATPEAAAQFGITADADLPAGSIDPAGGKVCWVNIDCVSWGSFSGNGTVPSPSGAPVAPTGIPDGMAIRRTIEPGCPTLLEPGDDRNDSAKDFFLAAPNPRPNSVKPTEVACSGPPEPLPRPQTSLRRKPAKRTHDRTPTFTFASNQADVHFECSLDRRRFRRCRSPFTTKALKPGRHRFSVRAVGHDTGADRTPASYAFVVLRRRSP